MAWYMLCLLIPDQANLYLRTSLLLLFFLCVRNADTLNCFFRMFNACRCVRSESVALVFAGVQHIGRYEIRIIIHCFSPKKPASFGGFILFKWKRLLKAPLIARS